MWIFSNLFTKMYEKGMQWARHKHAVFYLALISFLESNISPILPDVMLGPMALAHPDKAWRYAWITTFWTVIGGIAAYAIGLWAFTPLVEPAIHYFGWHETYSDIQSWLSKDVTIFGIDIPSVLIVMAFACLSPVPYKLFAFIAGSIEFNFIAFIVASFIDRGSRFYLVAGLMKYGGPRFERQLIKYMEWIGWSVTILIVGGYLLYRWLS